MYKKYKNLMHERLQRQKVFFKSREKGDLLVYINRGKIPEFTSLFVDLLSKRPISEMCDNNTINEIIGDYIKKFRMYYDELYAVENDLLPVFQVYFGIGAVTAAMTEKDADFISNTSWCEPNMDWDDVYRLKFNQENIWIQFVYKVNQALWKNWNEDFFFMPYIHRSPLDAANGIRGTSLFTDFYDHPEKAKWLVNFCADWIIKFENYLYSKIQTPEGWGRGVWGTYLPERAVFVNGDPVGMISREMQPIFERPYTEKVFTSLGGGFFHNHALGLYQVDQVSLTKGAIIQEILPDPNREHPAQVILNDEKMRNRIIESSLKVPIMFDHISYGLLDELLPYLKQGRFIISADCDNDNESKDVVRRVRKNSNIK